MIIENWRELVGVQTIEAAAEPDNNFAKVFYLRFDPTPKPDTIHLQILKEVIKMDLTEDQLCEQLDTILTSFPKGQYDNSPIGKARAGNQVARQSYRGFAKVEYKNSIFYRGETHHQFDAAVIVAERDGLFGIFKHPDFDQYGFELEVA